jgi:phage gp29-like protein
VPDQRQNWLSPRYEPGNISASATVADLQTAIRQAENGDTQSLFRFYRDSLLGDDHIGTEFDKRKLAVVGQSMAILPADKTNPDDVMAAAACLRAIDDCENWTPTLSALLGSSLWPVTLAEKVFRPADSKPVRWVVPKGGAELPLSPNIRAARGPTVKEFSLQYTLKRIEAVNSQLFCFRHAYLVGGVGTGSSTPVQQAQLGQAKNGNPAWYSVNLSDWEPFLRLWPTDDQGRILYDASQASTLDKSRHLVHRGHLMTEFRDNWGGPMRSIMAWWLLRGLGRDWFGRFMERYGSPFPVAKTNVQDPNSILFLRDALSTATKVGGLVIGQEDEVTLESAMVQGGAEGHALWHATCNNAISKRITGFGNGDKPAGINAGEEGAQNTVREDMRIMDQRMLAETLSKQLLQQFLTINGLSGEIRVSWGGLSDEDAATFANLLKVLGEAGFEPTDNAIPVLQDRLGLEIQRKAAPTGMENGELKMEKGGKDKPEPGEVETLSASHAGLKSEISNLKSTSAIPDPKSLTHPSDAIAARKAKALGEAFRGAHAPIREIILSAKSPEEAQRNLAKFYGDWSPDRVNQVLEEALQLCAAAGMETDKKV